MDGCVFVELLSAGALSRHTIESISSERWLTRFVWRVTWSHYAVLQSMQFHPRNVYNSASFHPRLNSFVNRKVYTDTLHDVRKHNVIINVRHRISERRRSIVVQQTKFGSICVWILRFVVFRGVSFTERQCVQSTVRLSAGYRFGWPTTKLEIASRKFVTHKSMMSSAWVTGFLTRVNETSGEKKTEKGSFSSRAFIRSAN